MADEVRIPLEIEDGFSAELRSLSAHYRTLEQQQESLHRKGRAGATNLAASYRDIERSVQQVEARFTAFGERTGRAIQGLIGTTVRWTTIVGGAGVAATTLLLREGIKLNSEFERYRLTLETVQKSQEKARATLAWIVNFAKTTPFEVQGLAESTAQLEALGLSARKWLPLIGDLSSAFGGSKEKIEELIRAVGLLRSGVSGEAFESLRRSGITRQDFEGYGVRFDKSGQLKSSPEAALVALEEIIRGRFGGMMDRLSQTFTGTMSNIRDLATNTLRDITAPLFATVTKEARGFLSVLDEMDQSGSLDLLVARGGSALNQAAITAMGFARSTILEPLAAGQGIGDIAKNIFEQAKGPAAEFATWFAGQLASGIVSAIGTLASSPEGRKALAVYGGYRFAPELLGLGFGLAGRGVGAVTNAAAASMAGYAPAIGITASQAIETRRAMAPVDLSTAFTGPPPSGLTSAERANWFGRNVELAVAMANAEGQRESRIALDAIKNQRGPLSSAIGAVTAGAGSILASGRSALNSPGGSAIASILSVLGLGEWWATMSGQDTWARRTGESLGEWWAGASPIETKAIPQFNRHEEKIMGLDQEFRGQLSSLKDEFIGLADAMSKFGMSARENVIRQADKIGESVEGMLRPLMSRRQIERSFGARFRDIERQGIDLYSRLSSLSRAGDAEGLMAMSADFARVNEQEARLRIDQAMMRFKDQAGIIKQNQGLIAGYGGTLGGSASQQFTFLRDTAEALRVRDQFLRTGTANVSFERLEQLRATGIIDDDLYNQIGGPALRGALVGAGFGDAARLLDQSGGFSSEGAVDRLQQTLAGFIDDFRKISIFDADAIDNTLRPLRDGIQTAFADAARLAADELVSRFGRSLPAVYSEALQRVFKRAMEDALKSFENGLDRGAFDPSVTPAGI